MAVKRWSEKRAKIDYPIKKTAGDSRGLLLRQPLVGLPTRDGPLLVVDDSPVMSAISRQTGIRNDKRMWDRRGISRSKVGGAEGQTRTVDTGIFSAVLYQLSYLGE